jgi:FixJ family two-component response regulator
MPEYKVAIVDDDEIFVTTIKELLSDFNKNFKIDYYTDSNSVIKAVNKNEYDLLILDYFIDKLTGEDVIKEIRKSKKELYIILLTGYSNKVPPLVTLQKLDIQDYCEKDHTYFEPIIMRIQSAIKSIDQTRNMRKKLAPVSFGKRLRSLREAKGEMQIELAESLNITRQALGTYESGRSEPTYELLKKIARHYNVSIDYLLDYK